MLTAQLPFPAEPLQPAFNWLVAHPLIPAIALPIIVVGSFYLWNNKVVFSKNISGQPLNPLGVILKRALRIAYKEDKNPVVNTPEKLAQKLSWLTWTRYSWIMLALTLIHLISPATTIIPHKYGYLAVTILITIGWLALAKHIRTVVSIRQRILMQMFDVACSEMKYDKGSELNPWGYVQILGWENLYTPQRTVIMYPPKYRSEERRNQEAFERNFNGTVSDQHTWVYKWESANNRVIADPVPYIPTHAPYPFPDNKPWNIFPLGEAAGGKEAYCDIRTFPHMLIAGTTGSGKLSALTTPIPVPVSSRHPDGWTTFGDIRPGDQVFDENGQIYNVTNISEINENPDLYEVVFSDGSIIEADAEHLWWTETRKVRESRWNANRKTVTRRLLISKENQEALRQLLLTSDANSEITAREVAEVANVAPESLWLQEILAEVGHVGELKIDVDFYYKEQTVRQYQPTTIFPARSAWNALATFQPKVPAWFALRSECAKQAAKCSNQEFVTSKEIAQVLNTEPHTVNNYLNTHGIRSKKKHKNLAFFPAHSAWKTFAEATSKREFAWLVKQEEYVELAMRTTDDEFITGREVAQVLGLKSIQEGTQTMRAVGIQGKVQKVAVDLIVPEKKIRRSGNWSRTYPTRELVERILERVQTPAHDQRHKNSVGGVRTTREIMETLLAFGGQSNHAIPVAKPLELPEANLPIDPYLLGVWLGDGDSRTGEFCGIDHDIAHNLEKRGFELTEKKAHDAEFRHADFRIWTVEGFRKTLRKNNLLQKNTVEGTKKHIPSIYLRASIQQRQDLLAGLLDTDGGVEGSNVSFTNTNRELAYSVHELALSLGYRATVREGRAIRTLPDGTHKDYGLKWTVSWTCIESPFYLPRKTKTLNERTQSYNSQRNDYRYVVDVRSIKPKPGRCIMVDSPSRLFLADRAMIPTHNSVTQRTILLHILQNPDWRAVLLDPKRVELSVYREAKNVLAVGTELEDMVELLGQVEQEMQSRYRLMNEQGVNNFERLPSPPPAVLLMIDEVFALLSPENVKSEEGKERDALHAQAATLIGSIARLGRAAGVHMVLATQRPDAKVLAGETRANLDCRIAQGRMDTTPSLMTLDSDAATHIPEVKGRAIVRTGNAYTEFQAYFVPEDELGQALVMCDALASGEISVEQLLGEDSDEVAEAPAGRFGRLLAPLGRLKFWGKGKGEDPVERAEERFVQSGGDGEGKDGGGLVGRVLSVVVPSGWVSGVQGWYARRKEDVEGRERAKGREDFVPSSKVGLGDDLFPDDEEQFDPGDEDAEMRAWLASQRAKSSDGSGSGRGLEDLESARSRRIDADDGSRSVGQDDLLSDDFVDELDDMDDFDFNAEDFHVAGVEGHRLVVDDFVDEESSFSEDATRDSSSVVEDEDENGYGGVSFAVSLDLPEDEFGFGSGKFLKKVLDKYSGSHVPVPASELLSALKEELSVLYDLQDREGPAVSELKSGDEGLPAPGLDVRDIVEEESVSTEEGSDSVSVVDDDDDVLSDEFDFEAFETEFAEFIAREKAEGHDINSRENVDVVPRIIVSEGVLGEVPGEDVEVETVVEYEVEDEAVVEYEDEVEAVVEYEVEDEAVVEYEDEAVVEYEDEAVVEYEDEDEPVVDFISFFESENKSDATADSVFGVLAEDVGSDFDEPVVVADDVVENLERDSLSGRPSRPKRPARPKAHEDSTPYDMP